METTGYKMLMWPAEDGGVNRQHQSGWDSASRDGDPAPSQPRA